MNWRWYLFWFRDFIKGRHIYKAYKDVEKVYYQQHDSNIDKKINNLIQTAKKNTKYYSNINSDNIKDFPIISKVIINENYTDFLSKQYKKEELHAMNTSGSTGIPFTILQNKEKRNRVIAELLFFDKICNYYFGEKQIFFRIWTEKNKKSTFQKFLQNMITEDISNLNEESLKEKALKLQKKYKVSNIISYASTLDVLSSYLLKSNYKPDDFSIKSIISGSEILQDTTREKLKKLFNCNIVSRYSNQENGVLAQEKVDTKDMYINNANYFIEFLKLDSDEQAEDGEIARVVVTDLYNYAMPMIRYDTGDLAICKTIANNTKIIKELYGRRLDLISDTKEKEISPFKIRFSMKNFNNIKQFKFQQLEQKKYKFILNMEENSKIDEEKLKNIFSELLGQDAEFLIEYVDEIPILSSGKRKYIENLCNK